MSTKSLTYVISDNKPVICMYRHYDGYLAEHGKEIAEFLKAEKKIGNSKENNISFFMPDIAAKLICFFKGKYPDDQNICLESYDALQEEEFTYIISHNNIMVKNFSKIFFEGTFSEFYLLCHPEKQEIQKEIELIEQRKAELEKQILTLKEELYQ